MCGIAGIFSFNNDIGEADEAADRCILDLLRHRGPDAQNIYRHDRLKLFHTRLQIIDTTQASGQPFFYSENRDALVFNGEIYNFNALGRSYNDLRTSGDVEVLYRLLREKKESALQELNGFFAFCYFDGDGSLLLARDRFGVKPLYYFSDSKRFVFASELKALMALAGPQQLNYNQLYAYLRLSYCSGAETIFKNVYRVLPGELLKISQGRVSAEQWYTVEKKSAPGDLYELLDDSVRLRLLADVPVGSLLSGGLDSSIISALAVRHRPQLKTFSIGFKNKDSFLDESAYAEMTAAHIRSDHHLFRLDEDDFLANIDDFLNAVDEPFADSSAFNVYMLSLHCRKHIKVALSGDGADELFKGYNKHRAFMLSGRTGTRLLATAISGLLSGTRGSRATSLANKKRQAEKFAMLARLPHEDRLKFLASLSSHADVAALLNEGVTSFYFNSLFTGGTLLPGFSAEDRFDMEHVLPDDMLVKVDRFSMRHGVEVRNPFLDKRIVEHALNLPLSEKLTMRNQKISLKQSFGKLLPKQILERPKKGFELPLERWLKTNLRKRIETDWLEDERVHAEGIFNVSQVQQLKKDLWTGAHHDAAARVWALVVFQQWLRNFSDNIAPPEKEELTA